MHQCSKCIMPDNYPRIEFDHKGVCNFCHSQKERQYKGGEALKSTILSHKKKGHIYKYDCAVGFSGGRDSSYLLFYLKNILQLNVVAITIDNGKIPIETKDNIKNITQLLGVDLLSKSYPYLGNCFNHHLKAWIHKPSVAMITTLCVGCRLGIEKGVYELMHEHKVPVFISGGTPFEGNGFKSNLLRFPKSSNSKFSLIFGYLNEIMRNLHWITNPYALYIQAKEFIAYYGRFYLNKLDKEGYVSISPFYSFIRWEEKVIVNTIENELGWKKNSQAGSTWRGDCDIALLKLYLYKKFLGFNDKDDALSDLIRDGQITREEALNRLEAEHHIAPNVVKDIMEENGVIFADFQNVLTNTNS